MGVFLLEAFFLPEKKNISDIRAFSAVHRPQKTKALLESIEKHFAKSQDARHHRRV